jgi:hypothetical protein
LRGGVVRIDDSNGKQTTWDLYGERHDEGDLRKDDGV